MLYFFTWNSEYLLKEQIKIWKDRFISKFWDFNLIHIKDIELVDNNFLIENITSASFLSEKKLVIIDLDKDISESKENFFLKIIEKIPENNIILFNSIDIDKRSKFIKQLIKLSEYKEFNTKWESDIFNIILNSYKWKITQQAINTIIKYKSWNLQKIVSEIDKLLIMFEHIDVKEIIENIIPELEEGIFQIIDDILNKKINEAIKKINIALNQTNIYALYNNLLSNLRTNIYIFKLKDLKKSENEISETLNLWSKSFLINKKYKMWYDSLQKLYINLVNIDKKMKMWLLNGTTDNDFKFELERVLLK